MVSDKKMTDNEVRGSGVAATTEPKDDRPKKVFPKKSEPENQDIAQIVEEFMVGTGPLQDARNVVSTAVGSDQVAGGIKKAEENPFLVDKAPSMQLEVEAFEDDR